MSLPKRPKPAHYYFNQNWQETIVGSSVRVLTPTNGATLSGLEPMFEQLTTSAEYLRNLDHRLGIIPTQPQDLYTVAIFNQEAYWTRFVEKANRDGFKPEAWYWSEGDVDTRYIDTLGVLFCINIDKCIPNRGSSIPTDIKRFILHELQHLWRHKRIAAPVWAIFEREGVAEAEARIGLGLQSEPEMQASTEFLLSSETPLTPPSEIIEQGYNHPSLTGKVSESPGYASCFLWYLGLALKVSGNPDLRTAFQDGNATILRLAIQATSRNEYFDLFQTELGINYPDLLQTTELMIQAQDSMRRQYVS